MGSELTVRSDQITTVAEFLEARKGRFGRVLGELMPAERFVSLAMTQIRRVPRLAECQPAALAGALMECAQLQLEPGVSGDCWILPFKGEPTFVGGYQGFLKLNYRSGQVKDVSAHIVYEGDYFSHTLGDEETLVHEPNGEVRDDMKKAIGVYAIIRTVMGGKIRAHLTRKQVEAIKSKAPSARARTSPWDTHPEWMWKKTALKQASKLAPKSIQVQRLITLDDLHEANKGQHLEDFCPDPDEEVIDAELVPPEGE